VYNVRGGRAKGQSTAPGISFDEWCSRGACGGEEKGEKSWSEHSEGGNDCRCEVKSEVIKLWPDEWRREARARVKNSLAVGMELFCISFTVQLRRENCLIVLRKQYICGWLIWVLEMGWNKYRCCGAGKHPILAFKAWLPLGSRNLFLEFRDFENAVLTALWRIDSHESEVVDVEPEVERKGACVSPHRFGTHGRENLKR
jgi:hypothetical protein